MYLITSDDGIYTSYVHESDHVLQEVDYMSQSLPEGTPILIFKLLCTATRETSLNLEFSNAND